MRRTGKKPSFSNGAKLQRAIIHSAELTNEIVSLRSKLEAAEAKVAMYESGENAIVRNFNTACTRLTESENRNSLLKAKVAALEKDRDGWKKTARDEYELKIKSIMEDSAGRMREALIAIRQGHESNEVDYMRDERIIGKALASIPAPEAPSESEGKPSLELPDGCMEPVKEPSVCASCGKKWDAEGCCECN